MSLGHIALDSEMIAKTKVTLIIMLTIISISESPRNFEDYTEKSCRNYQLQNTCIFLINFILITICGCHDDYSDDIGPC